MKINDPLLELSHRHVTVSNPNTPIMTLSGGHADTGRAVYVAYRKGAFVAVINEQALFTPELVRRFERDYLQIWKLLSVMERKGANVVRVPTFAIRRILRKDGAVFQASLKKMPKDEARVMCGVIAIPEDQSAKKIVTSRKVALRKPITLKRKTG